MYSIVFWYPSPREVDSSPKLSHYCLYYWRRPKRRGRHLVLSSYSAYKKTASWSVAVMAREVCRWSRLHFYVYCVARGYTAETSAVALRKRPGSHCMACNPECRASDLRSVGWPPMSANVRRCRIAIDVHSYGGGARRKQRVSKNSSFLP